MNPGFLVRLWAGSSNCYRVAKRLVLGDRLVSKCNGDSRLGFGGVPQVQQRHIGSIDRPVNYVMLCDFDGKRENNFTLMRLLFALLVLFGHSFYISANDPDPISALILPYSWIGGIAVDGFFVVSGLEGRSRKP